ncbi:MAG: nitrogen fixation negative regulator NifL [Thiotrichales bacterium]
MSDSKSQGEASGAGLTSTAAGADQPATSVGGDSAIPAQVFQQAVEQAALAIAITDERARIIYTNPAFQRVTGFTSAEVLGHNQSLLSNKVTPKIVYETMWSQLKRQRPWTGLLVNRRKDGAAYLAELTISPVVGAQGYTTHFLGMHRDRTDEHRLERELQNQKALAESVVDSAQVAIVLLDENERVVLDNHEYKKLVAGLGPEPAMPILKILRAQMGADFERIRQRGGGFSGQDVELEGPRHEVRWFVCSGSWIDEQGTGADTFFDSTRRRYLLLVIQEITALKAQQEAIRVNSLRALLAEQERIQSLREALSGAVFQLQAPFNRVAAVVRMLQARAAAADSPAASELEEALRAGNEVLETLRQCTPTAAEEALLPLNLNEVLRDVLHLASARMLAEGVVVDWRPALNLPAVSGRATRLTTLFKLLVDNALDAIHEARRERRELSVVTRAFDDRIEVTVGDSGTGIPVEWQYKIFEPFFTTKGSDHQHLGMGLTMAQEIVVEHGALIAVDTGMSDGCNVRVQFPRS